MVPEKEFILMFTDSDDVNFRKNFLKETHKSIIKSVIYLYVSRESGLINKVAMQNIQNLHEILWIFLKDIGDIKLDVYKDADKDDLLLEFIDSINNEKSLRSGIKDNKTDYIFWKKFRKILIRRVELYKGIFGFTKKDEKYCKDEAKKLREEIIKERKKRVLVFNTESVKKPVKETTRIEEKK